MAGHLRSSPRTSPVTSRAPSPLSSPLSSPIISPIRSSSFDPLLPTSKSVTPRESIIHARLGHPGADAYNRIAPVISVPKIKPETITLCPTCTLSKGTIQKGPMSSTNYTSPLQLIQVDLCGSFRYKNFTSDKFFMTIRDAYSRYYTVIHLKSKADAARELVEWITLTENYLFTFAANVAQRKNFLLSCNHGSSSARAICFSFL